MQKWRRQCLLLTDQDPPRRRRKVASEDPQLGLPLGEEEENSSSLSATQAGTSLLQQLFLDKIFYGCLNFMCFTSGFDNLLKKSFLL